MTLEDVWVHWYKVWNDVQKATGYSITTLRDWRRKGGIPMRHQIKIEEMTNGALKADFRHDPVYDKPMPD
jgi:hypothetical protein